MRKIACKHLNPKGDISNSLQPLCYCPERELVIGVRAFVCQVCKLYTPQSSGITMSEIYDESKKIAEKKIKEFEIEDIEKDDLIDLSIDEFEEDEEEIPLKFQKRKAGKASLEDGEDFVGVECPFCGEIYDDLPSHIRTCDLAPDDASLDDIMPSKSKKKRKKRTVKPKSTKATASGKVDEKESEKKKCPYCGKEFIRLGRHLNSCSKKPSEETEKE